MRLRLWARIGLTLAVNFVLLAGLGWIFLAQQNRGGLQSFVFAPARENLRELGARLGAEFPGKSESERTALLAELEKPWGVRLVVFRDTGERVAGPEVEAPDEAMREIRRRRGQGAGRPLFLVRQERPARYWAGFHFPLVEVEGNPPVRHTVVVITPTLLSSPFFLDWQPWLAGLSVALLATVVCWIPVVRRLTGSIEAMRAAAGEIAEGNFAVQVPANGGDELGELGASLGRMAQQLSGLVNGQRRFLADVAHELCAPLARIQLSAGILEARATEADRPAVERLERDVTQMSALVGDLLAFTKGAARLPELGEIRVAELVREIAGREGATGLETGIEAGLTVLADREHLGRALGNVLRNAIQYAGEAGPIRVSAERAGEMVHLKVTDCGAGLPEGELEAVFTPFHRLDAARTPGTGGTGLGLAIVKSAVEACGGTVWCRNRKPAGLEVILALRGCGSPAGFGTVNS